VTYLLTVDGLYDAPVTLATLDITGLPAGAVPTIAGSALPYGLVWNSGDPSAKLVTLTIDYDGSAADGSYPFTVTATKQFPVPASPPDEAIGNGTLTIDPVVLVPTITFGAAPTPEYPGPDFTVNATTDSDGALTYSYVSGPCTLVDANAGTFSPTGVGDCVVQADTAVTATFLAGSEQQTVTITPFVFDLYAVSGTTTLPGDSVTVWGYNSSNAPVTQPGGPTLVVNEGDTVMVMLHNELTVDTGLLFHGQDMIPDTTGVAGGGTKLYTFVANRPGTYLYGAGLLPGTQYQPSMGLYGALIVRPATAGQAYNDASTAYDDEAVLVLSEIDPALNNSANPDTFDMRTYKPRYFLINGLAYPDTTEIPTAAGNRVLLRYLNAGVQFHSMALLGTHQTVIANDGSPLAYSYRMVAETFGPGQTADTIVTIPATAVDGSKFAVYDSNLLLHNSNAAGFGGMMTFLAVSGTPTTGDTVGPVTSNMTYAAGTLSATVDDTAMGGSTVTAAEYFVDSAGAAGTGTAMSGAFATATEAVTAAVVVPSGSHTLYVRGMDSAGNWGALSALLVNGVDVTGPATTGLSLTPGASNGTANVAVHATGNDSASGGSDIVAAEYFIDSTEADGSGTAMTVNTVAPIASLDGVIAADDLTLEGAYTVYVHSQDSAGNWGAFATIDLIVDMSGPTTSNVDALPNPNNGQQGINSTSPVVRVTADFADTLVNLSEAEGFIDTVGADGTGFIFTANDGTFNSLSEGGYADIPLTTINLLSSGNHTIYVHAKDVAGNWGATSSVILLIDKTAPSISAVSATPNPTAGATSVTLSAVAADTQTNVIAAEWFTGADPGVGNGTAMTLSGSGPWNLSATIDVATWINGSYTLNVRAKDAAGNWSTTGNTNLVVDEAVPVISAVSAAPNPTAGATSVTLSATATGVGNDVTAAEWFTGADPGVGNGTAMTLSGAGPWSLSATIDVTAWVNGDYTLNVRARDVIGNWSATDSTILTVDAVPPIELLNFSTSGILELPGVDGPYDNADIYSWDGATFARVLDASGAGSVGLPGAANVDAVVVVDADTIYLSFNGNDTNVPTIGNVQDVDIILYDAGAWSFYFDGSDVGLADGTGEDVDAFEILPGGDLIFSTNAGGSVPGVTGFADEDLIRFTPTSLGVNTSGTWSMYFDASDVGLTNTSEDINGVAVVGGDIYITTTGNFGVSGLSGQGADVFICHGPTLGVNSACTSFSLYFDGSAEDVTNALDAIDMQ
jgi:hypothetical protein